MLTRVLSSFGHVLGIWTPKKLFGATCWLLQLISYGYEPVDENTEKGIRHKIDGSLPWSSIRKPWRISEELLESLSGLSAFSWGLSQYVLAAAP